MNRIHRLIIILGIAALALAGCSEKENDSFVPVRDLTVSPDFNWQAHQIVELDLEVLSNRSEPVSNVVFQLYDSEPNNLSSPIAKGATDSSGRYQALLNLPTRVNSIWAVGYMSTVQIPIVNHKVAYRWGGAAPDIKGGEGFFAPEGKNWAWLPGMTFNSQGRPSPMTNVPLEASFLSRIDASLPERIPLTQSHPQYMNPNNQTNLKIDELAEVWITFVTEGAGFKNSLGFHTYPSGNVPQSPAEVGLRTIVFPNASLSGSGGQMNPGDTVYLGAFQPGTTLGWFLVADGFTAGGSGTNVSTTKPVYYSNAHLNPESDPAKKLHSILLFDDVSQRFVVGFEDLPRMSGSDDDFNDLVFFFTVNPIEAVDMTDIQPLDIIEDRDGDGISDLFDDYPDDEELAFNNYTFGANSWGSLAFEDLWPNVGDYDFNDMVVDYNYNQITQAANRVKKVEMRFKLRAIGARKANGFAIELPFDSANIYAVNASHPTLFEHEQSSKAVMRMFNSAFDLIPQTQNFINTEINQAYVTPVEFSVDFKLQNPVNIVNVTMPPPYNPFIFADGVRSHEIHLPGYAPTALMNMSLFNTGNDASLPNNWYKTSDNLPWAVNIPASWDYPVENAQITRAFLKFKHWAQSSGASYPDWYQNQPGYRDNDFIYQTP